MVTRRVTIKGFALACKGGALDFFPRGNHACCCFYVVKTKEAKDYHVQGIWVIILTLRVRSRQLFKLFNFGPFFVSYEESFYAQPSLLRSKILKVYCSRSFILLNFNKLLYLAGDTCIRTPIVFVRNSLFFHIKFVLYKNYTFRC